MRAGSVAIENAKASLCKGGHSFRASGERPSHTSENGDPSASRAIHKYLVGKLDSVALEWWKSCLCWLT